jgi:hypothetical protein
MQADVTAHAKRDLEGKAVDARLTVMHDQALLGDTQLAGAIAR